MTKFLDEVVSFAERLVGQENKTMSNPVAVAGLADTVKNAIGAMNRAKQSADALESSAGKLVENIGNVDSIKTQLDAANAELEAAVAAVGAPLEASADQSANSGSAPSASPAPAPTTTAPTTTAPTTGAAPTVSTEAQIKQSIAQVDAANANK